MVATQVCFIVLPISGCGCVIVSNKLSPSTLYFESILLAPFLQVFVGSHDSLFDNIFFYYETLVY